MTRIEEGAAENVLRRESGKEGNICAWFLLWILTSHDESGGEIIAEGEDAVSELEIRQYSQVYSSSTPLRITLEHNTIA